VTGTTNNLVRLKLLSTNLRIVDIRRGLGLSQVELAGQTNLPLKRIADIENLRTTPTNEEMASIASSLRYPIDYLFPESLLRAVEVDVFSRRQLELQESQIISLTEARQQLLLTDGGIEEVEDRLDQELLQKQMAKVLTTLKPRECIVLEKRFGISGLTNSPNEGSQTLDEVAEQIPRATKGGGHVTRERIRQIEAKALRKLRHPSRSRSIKGFYE